MSRSRWRAILGDQLGVSDDDFWKSLRDNKPVERPSRRPLEEEIEQIPLRAADLLTARRGVSLGEIAQLGRDREMEPAPMQEDAKLWPPQPLASPCPTARGLSHLGCAGRPGS